MDQIETLTIRTTRALGRLAHLQRRADVAPTTPSIVRDALEELSAALEELRASHEHVAEQATQIAAARRQSGEVRRDYAMLFNAMPIACVFTDSAGTIADANSSAARLLNVGRQHLVGKPLILFFTNRDVLIRALDSRTEEAFEHVIVVRPRERKPRTVSVRGTRMPDGQRWCWFMEDCPQPAENAAE
jgi:two-component system cell cycle sensor histidine kinase/response regulator CckA